MAKAKLQQKRWHLDGGIEVTSVEEGGKSSPSTYLGNYNTSERESLALVAYTGSYYDLIDYPDLSDYIVDGDYVHTDNNFTDEEKAKLSESFNYVLPIATEKILGGVKVGDHLEMRPDPKDQSKNPVFDRISVIEDHFIAVKDGEASSFSEIPTNGAGQLKIIDNYSPTGDEADGYYVRYNDMVFYSEDVEVDIKTVNGKTIKIEQEYMNKGGLWWTTKKSGRWIKILDQFNIVSFNDRVGKVYPVGMDDYLNEAEDYDANMVGAMARSGHPGAWTTIKDEQGKIVRQFWNGCSIDSLKIGDSGWAKMGSLKWNAESKSFDPDLVNSPTGGIINGTFWKLDGLPTLPTYNPDPYYPDTYRGAGKGSFFFMPDDQDRIWVKRGQNWEDNDWFYLEQLPIATRTRLGGVIVGNGLDVTDTGVLSVAGFVTSWTGKQGDRRVNDVVAMAGDYDALMITFGDTNVDAELKRLVQELNKKAPLHSPIFTGEPKAPTPSAGENSTRIATTNWVRSHVSNAIQDIVGYELPPATTSELGGIIVGSGLTISASGVLSVNIQGGGTSNPVVIDSALSTSSSNPVENRVIASTINAINNKFDNYVLKNGGVANSLTVNGITINGNNSAPTQSAGTNNTTIATTAFVMNAINNITGGGGSGSGPTITPYVLPIANASTLGGVRVTGNDGIGISNNGTISVDYDKLQISLNFISSKNVVGSVNIRKSWGDIPRDSSGYVFLQAAYSPTSKEASGYYIKYNYHYNNTNPEDNYVMWFCDSETNDMWYLIHTPTFSGWSKTLSMDGAEAEDFDLSLYAKINSPVFTGDPQAPTPVYGRANPSSVTTVEYVATAVTQLVAEKLAELPKASTTQYGVVKVQANSGIDVNNGVISNSGLVKFNGRTGVNGNYVPQAGDYTAALIDYGFNGQSNVQGALSNLYSNKAPLANPVFTGTPKVGSDPVATHSWVEEQIGDIPIASTTTLGLVKIGNGLTINSTGVLSASGAVTSWKTRTGDVSPEPGDYHSAMIYYEQGNSNQTVKSELDSKAYLTQVWRKGFWSTWNNDYYRHYAGGFGLREIAYPYSPGGTRIGGSTSDAGGVIYLPMSGHDVETAAGAIVLTNDAESYGAGVVSVPNLYIATQYYVSSPTYSSGDRVWPELTRLLTTRDLESPNFTGTPKINGVDMIGSSGELNIPIASASVLGGVKIGSGISVDGSGTISVSGTVTMFGPDGNKRTGDVVPQAGDYDATQITYNTTSNVGDELDGILDGTRLPIATNIGVGGIKLGDHLVSKNDRINPDFIRSISLGGSLGYHANENNVNVFQAFRVAEDPAYSSISTARYEGITNSAGVRRVSGVADYGADGINTNSNKDLIATYFSVGTDIKETVFGGRNNFYIRYLLNIAAFFEADDTGEKIQGLYYARSDGSNPTSSAIKYGKWIKLIDAENISDYIQDTSSFYNTENYTTAEVDDAIQATLTELAS